MNSTPRKDGLAAFAWLAAAVAVSWSTALALLVVSLCSCTITPITVRSAQPSFDGIHQDSGFLGFAPNGAGYISDQAKARYNALTRMFGSRFPVPVLENDGIDPKPIYIGDRTAWILDPEHVVKFETMSRWRKEAPR